MQAGEISDPYFSLSKTEDGTINASLQRSWTFDDENYKEWKDFVIVNPDNTIQIGYVNLTYGYNPDQSPHMKPFVLQDLETTETLLGWIARRV